MITVFKNGRIHTMEQEMPYVSAIAIQDDKIVYVGNDAGAAAYEQNAKVVDLKGKMVLPGLIDSHCHPTMAAFFTCGILCDAEMTHDDVIETIRTYIAEHPEQELYFGMGYPEWEFDENGPRKEELDAICADKAVFLMGNGGHDGWCNTKTFELLGITKDTPDSLPGLSYFRRDESGELTGHVVEATAMDVVMSRLPWFDPDTVNRLYRGIFDRYASLGVTCLNDCGSSGDMENQGIAYMSGFEERGELKQRICGCVRIEDPMRLPVALGQLEEQHEAHHSDLYNINTFKVVNDGIVESESAAMVEDYPSGANAEPMSSGEVFYQECLKAAQAGFNIHVHAIGDKTIHETLMMSKAIREAGCFDTRIVNAHTHITQQADLPLFSKYNVCANTSSIWHYDAPESKPLLGEFRYDHQFQLGSILRHGARLTLGSDFPVDEMGNEPLKGVQMGVTRQVYNDHDAPILESAGERLSVEQCLAGYTINAAYGMHLDDKIGSLKVGKYADLVILEKDLCDIDPLYIMDTPILLTVMNGQVTYQNETFRF